MKESVGSRKALVTGGAGFLGLHLANELLSRGIDVVVADIVGASPHSLGKMAEFIECDLTRPEQLNALPRNVAVVYHLAALSSPLACEQRPDLAFKLNVQATYNVLRFCVESSVKKIVFPSAAHIYGDRPQYLPIDEKHPVDMASHVYNATKKICEDMCRSFYENHNLDYVTFRLFNVYGPGQSTDFFIPSIITQGLSSHRITVNNGRPRRDFVYVGDIMDAFVKAGESSFSGGPINLGTGRETSIAEVARLVAGLLNSELTILEKGSFGPMRSRCDNSLARRKLKWKPMVSLRQGLINTVKWYEKNATKGVRAS